MSIAMPASSAMYRCSLKLSSSTCVCACRIVCVCVRARACLSVFTCYIQSD